MIALAESWTVFLIRLRACFGMWLVAAALTAHASPNERPFPRQFFLAPGVVATCAVDVSITWPKADAIVAERLALELISKATDLGTFLYASEPIRASAAATLHLSNVRYGRTTRAQIVANAGCSDAVLASIRETVLRVAKYVRPKGSAPVVSATGGAPVSALVQRTGYTALSTLHQSMQSTYSVRSCSYRVDFRDTAANPREVPDDRDAIRFLVAVREASSRYVLPFLQLIERDGSVYFLLFDECERAPWFAARAAADRPIAIRRVTQLKVPDEELMSMFGLIHHGAPR